jgi:hypothetical protein
MKLRRHWEDIAHLASLRLCPPTPSGLRRGLAEVSTKADAFAFFLVDSGGIRT